MDSVRPTREQLERDVADLRRQLAELTAGQTGHTQPMDELRASRDRFRDLVESTSDWVWEVDRDGVYTYASPRVRDLLGREPDDLIGTTPFDIMPPAEAERVLAIFQDIVSRAEPFENLENVCLHADGREVVMETSGVPVLGPDGDLRGYRGIDRDITERKRTLEALRESEAFTKAVMDNLPIGIAVNSVDPAVKFDYMNDKFPRFYRTTRQALADPDAFWDAVYEDPEFREEIRKRVLDDCASGDPDRMHWEDVPITRQGDETTFVTAMNTPVPDKKLMISTVWDVTGRKRAEEERDRLEEQLRQAYKMEAVGQLAGGIAHDFNNILTIIKGNAELLKMALPSAGEQAEFIDEVIKGANRAADLTGQLLAFARKGKWQVVPIDIHGAIDQTVSMLTHAIDKRIEVRLELNASPSIVMGDPTQLQNALLNLGVNARDAMIDGGMLTYATRNVTLAEADCDEHPYELTPGDFLEIRVTDTGTGMDAQTQERIFEPFFTTKEVGKGTGLGLAGVYGCVKSHDGSISVSSEPGRGATFTILLPMAPADAAARDRTASGDGLVRGTGHVLVVDDEQSVCDFVSTSLQGLGYTVRTCNDGAAGVDCYREHHQEIDLVILDLIMPKMSGQDALREMKRINPNVRVLVSSGFSCSQAARRMLDEGVLALLNKPFRITELSQAVAEHIQRDRPG